jgi:uncharacterized membrane protein
MSKETSSDFPIVFSKKNYVLMSIGILIIALGFILMLGNDANTTPEGIYNPHFWNEDIFSFRRIRLAPTLVIFGFIVEIYAIFYTKKKSSESLD